jgi:hypothetical protein
MVPPKRGRHTAASEKISGHHLTPKKTRQRGSPAWAAPIAGARPPASPRCARDATPGDAMPAAPQIGPCCPSAPRDLRRPRTTCGAAQRAMNASMPSPPRSHLRSAARRPASGTTAGEPRGKGPAAPFTGLAGSDLGGRREVGGTGGAAGGG